MGFITFDVLKHSLLKIKTMIDNKANSSHNHNPSDINTDSNNRFVTDDEKAKINVIVTDGYGNQALLDNGSYGFVGGVSIDDDSPSDLTTYSSTKIEEKLSNKSDKDHTHTELHTHDNKTILDTITTEKIQAWDSASGFDDTEIQNHMADSDIHVTTEDKQAWDNKSDFSGSYNDLVDKPSIPPEETTETIKTKLGVVSDTTDGYLTSDQYNELLSGSGGGGALIDDVTPSTSTVYSSQKVEDKLADIHTHDNKTILDEIVNTGDGTKYLTDDGTYKEGTYITQEIINEISNPLTTTDISQESPVGSVIAYMGLTAPIHYLVMDGSIYNIADYPHLAEHFRTALGQSNYYGGDGITTFAVPDARGEFIRGYDATNLRDPLGSNRGIGKHEDGTMQISINMDENKNLFTYSDGVARSVSGYDKANMIANGSTNGQTFSSNSKWKGSGVGSFVARPTNINVLYCIKYEPTYYAVNQYGGFQQQTLWAGELSTISSPVTLSDSVNNYSHIYVTSVCDTGTSTSVYSRTEPIIVENIELNKGSGLVNNFFKNPTNYYNIAYEFVDNTTFQINEIDNAGFLNPRITKIVGVYGQLPSLIMGGEF